jgi:hypothetical protein
VTEILEVLSDAVLVDLEVVFFQTFDIFSLATVFADGAQDVYDVDTGAYDGPLILLLGAKQRGKNKSENQSENQVSFLHPFEPAIPTDFWAAI